MNRPTFSLIVPTRGRPARLRRFLDSIAATASRPMDLEVVLVIDADDDPSLSVRHRRLALCRVVVPPGLTMGALNTAGFEASAGDHVMLLNDDVEARTPGWDVAALTYCRRFSDGILLIHVNDTLFQDRLCTFPLLSRRFCELAGGICPAEYVRYRIDDHIEDVFNLLAALGVRRTVYLPDVVFKHFNTVERPCGDHVYQSDPEILAGDARRFEASFCERKELAMRLLDVIEGGSEPSLTAARRRLLDGFTDPIALRTPGRQLVARLPWLRRVANRLHRPQDVLEWADATLARARACVRMKGWGGLARAGAKRVIRLLPGGAAP
jgi:glycosyltransferase involved in cell wall biosynthesis